MAKVNLTKWLEALRAYIDGPDLDDPAAQIVARGQPRGTASEYMMEIARAIHGLIHAEMLGAPKIGGTVDVPERFLVYLSAGESKNWPGRKRDALAAKLSQLALAAARDWAGQATLAVSAITVEIETDAALSGNEFRVEAVWDVGGDDERTVVFTPAPPPEDDEGTRYEPEDDGTMYEPLFAVEVWRDGRREGSFSAAQTEIVIGRKTGSSTAEVALAGDARVARVHARLRLDEAGRFWLKAESRNPTRVNGCAYRAGDAEVEVTGGAEIAIYDFTLKLLEQSEKF